MIKAIILLVSVLCLCVSCNNSKDTYQKTYSNKEIKEIYDASKTDLDFEVFARAIRGLNNLKKIKRRHLITIIDYSKSSHLKRLYVFDLHHKKLIFNDLVSHGVNSGKTLVDSFSNIPDSRQSSVGFMKASETYEGKHGLSLRLDGLEKEINDSVRYREITIHSADYATQEFIDKNGYLGRSHGCPAIPPKYSDSLIKYIANGSCVYLHTNSPLYLDQTQIK